ncbi:MAG: CinA family protein [Candidatus Saganbacteria bacterium]|nr:CinA family protein [Candidatus Saganbacteria bacterium]
MQKNNSKEVKIESFSSKMLSGLGRITDDQVAETLKESNQTVSAAESLTGGLVCERLTNIAGSSVYFMGGIVSYHNRIKVTELQIPGSVIAKHGAVSIEVAKAMAEGIRKRFKTDIGLSSTGCAGPDPQPPAPVGLAYVSVASIKGTEFRELHLQGTRQEIREKAAQAAIGLLWEHLEVEK